MQKRPHFTTHEIAFVKANYKTMSNQQMADELNRTNNSVRNLLHRLKLKREETRPTKELRHIEGTKIKTGYLRIDGNRTSHRIG